MDKNGDSLTQGEYSPSQQTQPWWIAHRMQVISFGVLIALLLGVIFILPNTVNQPTSQSAAGNTQTALPSGKAESPWSEAQRAKQRREAQTVLAEILKLQRSLEEKNVKRWAELDYQDAMDTAAAGDDFYRLREFSKAQQQYRDSLAKFNSLADSVDPKYEAFMLSGQSGLTEGDSEAASTAFELASLIRPDSTAAQKGIQQAQALNGVLAKLDEAELQRKAGNLEAATDLVKQALKSDPDATSARSLLKSLKADTLERNFTAAMSEGYAALQNAQFSKSRGKFKRALALKPQSNEAKTALAQAGNQQTQVNIKNLLAAASDLEAKESWQEAQDKYEQALALDKSIITARIGKIRSETRNSLDRDFKKLLADPERLTSEAVYKQAQLIIKDASGLAQSSPRLHQQIAALKALLGKAVTPITVHLQSDELTEVTLYKIGRLGSFKSHSLDLKPGSYVAVGKRDGYRDVRQEFNVSWSKTMKAVIIQCEERVALLQ